MKKEKPTRRTAGKYALCQLPGALLAGGVLFLLSWFSDFPLWLAWTLFVLWVAKDALLFPFVWPAYSTEPAASPMVGRTGEARDLIDPRGYVRVGEELWRAELPPGALPIARGERLRVVDQRGLTLIVEKLEIPDS